ncbi:MAG: GAF domain-containing protein [Flammeovirgaceae bacterium]
MHDFKEPKGGNTEKKYIDLIKQIESLTSDETDVTAILSNISAAIKQTFNWLWVGFYLVKEDELILGPFQGPVACFRIKKGDGVCGATWEKRKTIIVKDVEKFPGHIACSSESKSEIVLPIFKNNNTFGVLDVDSKELDTFNEIDKKYLKKIIEIIEKKLV